MWIFKLLHHSCFHYAITVFGQNKETEKFLSCTVFFFLMSNFIQEPPPICNILNKMTNLITIVAFFQVNEVCSEQKNLQI